MVSAPNDLIWKSWDEAWAQSRHLESMRSQYLGFFFTVLLAAAFFAIKEGAKGGWLSSSALLLPVFLALGVELLAAALLAFVRRIGEVLVYYMRVIVAIRDDRLVDVGPDRPSWAEPWPLSNTIGPRWRLRSTQGASQLVLEASIVATTVALLALAIRMATLKSASSALIAFGIVAAVMGVGGRRLIFAGLAKATLEPRSHSVVAAAFGRSIVGCPRPLEEVEPFDQRPRRLSSLTALPVPQIRSWQTPCTLRASSQVTVDGAVLFGSMAERPAQQSDDGERVRRLRLRADGQRPLAVNLEETILLTRKLFELRDAARRAR